jgi:hypothetical protein
VSDSYVIEIGRPRTAIAGGFAIPPEEDKAALSLSALIVKTERLHAARQSLAPADLTERAAGLAVEQRMVRSETLFLMGAHGEVADEDAEAEHSHEIQEGRLENRGQADLRQATRLMSAAERSLLLADTGGALTSQRAALAAMQRALSRVRYFLRTLPVRSQIDPTRRLSGDLTGASTWTQRRNGSPGDDRMARTRQLLGDLSALALARRGDTTAWKAASADAGDLARRLLAIDPASTQLQDAARGLEELADAPATLAEAEWRQRLSQAAQALQQRLGDAPPAVPVPPALESGLLRGAFADALAGPGGRK